MPAVLRMLKVTMPFLCAASLAGCGDDPAREAVAAALDDPDSARFQLVRDRPNHVCGEVNGRGEGGAFVGYRRFVYDKEAGVPLIDPGTSQAVQGAARDPACGKSFAYQSVDERLNCAHAPAARSEAERQRRFEAIWGKACA